jgi:hypothetical protein
VLHHAKISGTLSRLGHRIGLKRVAKDVSLDPENVTPDQPKPFDLHDYLEEVDQ